MPTLRIDNILGGQSPSYFVRKEGQSYRSVGVDPGQPAEDGAPELGSCGGLRPIGVSNIDDSTVANAILWADTTPKNQLMYMYGMTGSLYSVGPALAPITAISDGGSLSSSSGNGFAYYDNYLYFAKNTDIARYGPLSGAPVFNGTYWSSTLGMAALTDTTYPLELSTGIEYPNHVMHRHRDGALYICDVSGGKGVIHKIKTTKTAVEGDTDNGSTEQVLDLPYGMYPTCLESYGSELAIALWEGTYSAASMSRQQRAKIAFWDTTSDSYSKMVFVEFPDQYISAMKNVNGVLYVISGTPGQLGMRLTRFIGGYTFEEIYYSGGNDTACLPGTVISVGDRLMFAGYDQTWGDIGGVYSWGLKGGLTKSGLFNVSTTDYGYPLSALAMPVQNDLAFDDPVMFSTQYGGTGGIGTVFTDVQSLSYGAYCVWSSGAYEIGRPFIAKRLRFPIAYDRTSDNNQVTVTITTDNNTENVLILDENEFVNGETFIDIETNVEGEHYVEIQVEWDPTATGADTEPTTILMPIELDFEYVRN